MPLQRGWKHPGLAHARKTVRWTVFSQAISVEFQYAVGPDNMVNRTQIDMDVRTPDLLEEDFVWINGMFNDFRRA